jgi:hypothetical protein
VPALRRITATPKQGTAAVSDSAPRAAGYATSAETRPRILAAALEEASRSGIHNASLAAIAAQELERLGERGNGDDVDAADDRRLSCVG